MNRKWLRVGILGIFVCMLTIAGSMVGVTAQSAVDQREATLLASGLEGASGSAIGPSGALYVTEGAAGRVSQIDPQSGEITTFASGLPQAVAPIGGANDLAFIGETAYVLVTMVGNDLNPESESVVGIYRVDSPDSFTVIADIGEFTINNPSQSQVDIPSGVHYALDTLNGDFLVTDGHHNWVLTVTLDGEISVMRAFNNIVPTGLAVWHDTVYMAEAGPNPHESKDGKIIMFGSGMPDVSEVAVGAPLLVDVEHGPQGGLYALSQGAFPQDGSPGDPALHNTGALVKVNTDGSFSTLVAGLNQPTSLEFIGNTAYIVTLTGEVWMVNGVN